MCLDVAVAHDHGLKGDHGLKAQRFILHLKENTSSDLESLKIEMPHISRNVPALTVNVVVGYILVNDNYITAVVVYLCSLLLYYIPFSIVTKYIQ